MRFFCFLFALILLSMTVFADPGEGNMDGGGGEMGSGGGNNVWMPGRDGVRVTVIRDSDNKPFTTPIDYTNNKPNINMYSFSKANKINYQSGVPLTPNINQYQHIIPDIAMPRIVSTDGATNINEVKKYFVSEYAAMMIAKDTGIPYTELIGGIYKLLLEPIAYFTFSGTEFGMTATEAALYDMQLGGGLRSAMGNLTHKNLPLSMFLEVSDLGFPAWGGTANGFVNNEQITSSLGLGIVRYKDQPPDQGAGRTDYEYRTDTEVITAVTVSTGSRLTPDNPATVTFSIQDANYIVEDIVIPAGDEQVVWCKWRTPKTPQTVTIRISCDGASVDTNSITAKVVDLDENPPPNPTARDRNDGYSIPSVPSKPQQLSASWSVWRSYWLSVWEKCWHSDEDGDWYHWVDKGDWDYTRDHYSATLAASGRTMPDQKAVTASDKTMKSGYGINIDISTRVSTNAPAHHTTWAQNAVSYFPEFNYDTYWRLHDRVSNGYNATLELKNNKYSTYNRRVHFLPVWFPDTKYMTYTQVIDAWTPAGMLSMNVTDHVNVKQSVFDDWHIAPK